MRKISLVQVKRGGDVGRRLSKAKPDAAFAYLRSSLLAQQRRDLLAEGGYLVVEFLLGSAAEAEVQHIGS